jgi:hypothetical protein
VEGREREGKRGFARAAAGGVKENEGKRQDKKEERRRTDGLSQGLIRKIRELQGLVCKAKFPIDLKP